MLLRPLTQMKCEDNISQHPLYNQSSPRTLSHMWAKVLNMCSLGFFFKKRSSHFITFFQFFSIHIFVTKDMFSQLSLFLFVEISYYPQKILFFSRNYLLRKKFLKFQLNVSWIILQLILLQNCVITLNNFLTLLKIIS